jgi:predicted nucleic acid-binding protein
MIVVADATPIQYLVRIETAGVLRQLYGHVLIPQTVAAELQHTNTPAVVRDWIDELPNWCEIRPDPAPDPRLAGIDAGERAAIGLADLLRADIILMDDRQGRAAAEDLGLIVTGTIGVLAQAHRMGLLDFEDSLVRLRKTNFRVSPGIVEQARRELWR